jgi:hypothetical protein
MHNFYIHGLWFGPKCMEIQGVKMLTLSGCSCCFGFMNLIDVIAGVGRQTLAISIWPNWIGSIWKERSNPVSATSCFNWKIGWWIMSKIVIVIGNITFRKLSLFSPSDKRRDTYNLLGSLERVNLNRWPSSHMKAETVPVFETMFSSYLEFQTMEKSP